MNIERIEKPTKLPPQSGNTVMLLYCEARGCAHG
jgi:hypothetical protein